MLNFVCLFIAGFDLVFGDGHIIRPVLQVSLPNGNATLESVEYDSTNQLLFYQSFFDGIIYVADYDASAIAAGTYNLSSEEEMDNNMYTMEFPTAMYADGTYLYVVSAANGYVTRYNISSKTADNQIEITYNGNDTRLNGMCNDPTDENIVYITGPGADFIYTSSYTNDSALYRMDLSRLSVKTSYFFSFVFWFVVFCALSVGIRWAIVFSPFLFFFVQLFVVTTCHVVVH